MRKSQSSKSAVGKAACTNMRKSAEKSTVKFASDSLLELCRGLKKPKSVGMIALDPKSPDYVPSLPKPSFKSVLMNFRLVGDGPEHKHAEEPKPQERLKRAKIGEDLVQSVVFLDKGRGYG